MSWARILLHCLQPETEKSERLMNEGGAGHGGAVQVEWREAVTGRANAAQGLNPQQLTRVPRLQPKRRTPLRLRGP